MAPDPLTIARRLTARGLVVIPVYPPGPVSDGKMPAIAWKRYQTERPTRDDLYRWFTEAPINLAVVTGHLSGVVVVDVDGDDGLDWADECLPDTPWMTETAKGIHYYFQHPGGQVENRGRLAGGLAVDVKGDGGLVNAPGSQHRSGRWYRCAGDWRQPRSALPIFNAAWLPTPFAPPGRVTNEKPLAAGLADQAVDVRMKRAAAYLAAVPLPEIGCGSDRATFIAAAHLVRGFALSATDAETLLWAWAGGRPGWDQKWIAQKVKSACRHGKQEMGAFL